MHHDENPASGVIRVVVADDTSIHTQLLAGALERDPGLRVVAAHSSNLVETAILHNADVSVVSSNLEEDPLRSFEVLRELRAAIPKIKAVVLLESSKREIILEAFQAGAKGVFSRHESLETLCQCVRQVHAGQIWANSQQVSFAVEALASTPVVRAVGANGLSLLSKRELEVVRLLAEGLTNREIAERMELSQHTIKNYLFRVFDKLGVSSRMELLCLTLAYPAGQAPGSRSGAGAGAKVGDGARDSELASQQRAAEQGVPSAQIALARLHAEGKQVERDSVAAYMWYLLAEQSLLEMKDAISNGKRRLAESLTTDEILEAQKKASTRLKKSAQPTSLSSEDVNTGLAKVRG